MKINSTYLSCLATLLFLSIHLQSYATVTIEFDGEDVYVSTSENGVQGYDGCDPNKAEVLDAYVYSLYKRVIKEAEKDKDGNPQTCSSCSYWIKVAGKTSNLSTESFPNMGVGEYKATVYAGQAIGCQIEGDSKGFPTQSIVYQQEKSTPINLEVNSEVFSNTSANGALKNDALKVFPNPTSGSLHIQMKDHILQSEASIVFYDLLGKEAMKISRPIDDQQFQEWQLDVSAFSEGAYILRIADGEGNSYEKKVIVSSKK